MSLITRCPACGTQFRVVPDQLKISDGWVRCGQCSQVFDAQASLAGGAPAPVPEPVPAPASASASASAPEPAPEPAPVVDGFADIAADDEPAYEPPPLHPVPEALAAPAHDAAPEPDLQWTTPLEPTVSPEPVPAPQPEPVPQAEAPGPIEPVLDPLPDAQPPAAEFPPEAAPVVAAPEPVIADADADATDAAQACAPAPSPEPALDQVSFVRQARRRALWQRPVVRLGLVLLACLLGLLLAAQVALQQRDTLAQQAPGLRPVLEALCQPLGCRVGPPRRIEALVIDNSNFSRLRTDAYKLAVTLANQAPTAVAMPALELTLTDSQDQPILRRVIAPAELGQGAAGVIGPNAQWSATLTVAVTPNAATARIVGYRLLAFYP